MSKGKSICYLSNDFSKCEDMMFYNIEVAPERLLNGEQIRSWVAALRDKPLVFATCSLFLIREIQMQGIPCTFVNIIDGEAEEASDDVDSIGEIEILKRELEQSDRYLELNLASVNP